MVIEIEKQKIKWLPLEANPDIWTKIVQQHGVDSKWSYTDVYGFDPELLAMVPQPVKAVIFLFPITEAYENYRRDQEKTVLQQQPTIYEDTKHVHFFKQTISNACGMIGLLHSLANNDDVINTNDDKKLFPKIIKETKGMTPAERATYLEGCAELAQVHSDGAQQGQTEAPSLEEQIYLHFICFVEINDQLYELDGRQAFPINHGKIQQSLLYDAAIVMKGFMERDPEESNFSAIALTCDE
ncbi:ubiquitin carboxyl-terminal esterase L3, isoform CRA_b [Halteromyces radiatus]|uniref:ubiquitin carboxyl-terminal esterase L3, isoform CRA_b n=1 Tax=Halteromyces radiatus TaxID=101107 RepID=UPI00221FE38F|nr:ubiquitin carboxyl-terminal esterase L3, isoform CRA_b [Halteromyces radiatus]KAI8099260.1 ubiquitin carboxyl-terminal esterase L3, isoform CRA_b [Halteromyces radiatus]